MKKILSVLLVAAMLMSFSVCAFAEDAKFAATPEGSETATKVDTLQKAVDEVDASATANDGGVVEVTEAGSTVATKIDVSDGSKVEIDLNGNNLSITDPATGDHGTLGMQIVDTPNDVSGKVVINGEGATITFENVNDGGDIKMGINNYTNLELVDVTINANKLADGTYALSNNNNGDVVIGERASIIAAKDGVAFDVYVYADGNYEGGPSVTVEDGAGTIDGAIEFDGSGDLSKLTEEDEPSLDIKGGNFVNFVLKIGEAVREYVDNINISGGTFDTKNVEGKDANGKAYTFEQFLVEDHVVVEQNGKFVVMTKAAYEASNKKDEVVAVIPAETYVPPVYEAVAGNGNATIEVDGKEVAVKLDSTVVSATAAPVALADAAPVVVKVNVAHTALSANVFTAIEMVETLSETLEVKGADGAVIEAEQYEVEFDGHGQIQIKLSAELMQKLGVGTHVLKINLGGYEIEVTIVIQ